MMVVDPKYANLPWIAHGQPDVYEAGELAEADQRPPLNDMRDAILPKEMEIVKISVDEAHKRFADSKLDSTNVDFSDSISGRGKVGYAVVEEYDVLPPDARSEETLLNKYHRLQTEIEQLISDMTSVDNQVKSDKVDVAELSASANMLKQKLSEIKMENLSERDASLNTSGILEKVLSQLDSFKSTKPVSCEKPPHLVYEVYDRQSLSKQADVERVAELDRRIHRLEALIGQPDPVKLAALTADTSDHSLLEATSRMATRSALLQPGYLDMIEPRLVALQTKLQTITDKRSAIAEADTQNKVAELYELVKKWNDVANSLPMIVDRLTELRELHEEASEFSNILSNIEASQKTVNDNMKTYSKLLEEVQSNISENMEVVKQNVSSLESRLKK